MRILALAIKDLLQILRDWKAAVFLLASPILFTLFFGFLFSSQDGEEADSRLPVALVDQDQGALSAGLADLLGGSTVLRLVQPEDGEDLSEVQRQVAEGDLAALVLIPEGYTASLQTGGKPKAITIQSDPSGNAGISVETELRAAAGRLQSVGLIAQAGADAYASLNRAAEDAGRESFYAQTLSSAIQAWGDPPIEISMQPASALENAEQNQENPFAHSSPGMMAQFAIAGLMGAAEILVRERKTGALARLLTTATGRMEILTGHFLAMFMMITIQFGLLIAFGQIFLGLNYANDWSATALVALSMALATAGMGLLIGVLSKTEEQVILFTLMPMFILSGLGGAWVPLEFTPPTVQAVSRISPVTWMMSGLKGILLRGHTWQQSLVPAGALLLFAIFFTTLAVVIFNRVSD